MKKLFLLLAVIALVSCEKETIEDPVIEINIDGRWDVMYNNTHDVKSIGWYFVFRDGTYTEIVRGEVQENDDNSFEIYDNILIMGGDVYEIRVNGDNIYLKGDEKYSLRKYESQAVKY